MNIHYTSDGEGPAIMTLDQLIANFKESETLFVHGARLWEDDMRDELESRGWYENTHDCGRFLVLNMDKFFPSLVSHK